MVRCYLSLAVTGLVISGSLVLSANVPDLKMAKLDVGLMKEYLASQFIQATDDFETAQLNSVYFPLEKSVVGSDENYDEQRNLTDLFVHKYRGFQLATAEKKAALVADFMHSLSSQNVTELSKITSWNTVLKEDLTRSALFILPASWRYLLADQVYDKVISNPRDWSDMVNLQPANLGFLFKAAQELRTEHEYYKGIQDKAEDLFAKSVKLPQAFEEELGYILAYRWGIQDLKRYEDEFSLENLVKLPADAVLAINEIYFDKVDLEEKLKNSEVFADKDEGDILPWFSLAERYLGSTKLKNEFSDFKPLVLAAPLDKMVSMMQYVEDTDLVKIMTTYNLNPVRAQEIWKVLVAKDSAQSLEDIFFKIGHKLDIEQINTFYDNEFVNLYSHRHDLEVAWIGRTVNVPWSHVKHVSNRHFPTSSIDRWGPLDLINLGKFAVGLSFSALKSINPTAISGDTLEKIISPSMTKGQLCILYDALNKSKTLDLPEELYACVEASVINGNQDLKIKEIQPLTPTGTRALIRQSSRFSPAQKAALMSVLEETLWTPEILSTILLHNPTLLAAVSNKEFRENIEAVRDAIVEAGIQNLPTVSNNILKLPRRLLTTWLEATVVITEFGKIDVDVLLDRPSSLRAHSTDSTEVAVNLLEHATALDSLFPSLAISGLTCDMIAKIPAGEIVEVISALRFRIGEDAVIHSGTRKCLARAVRDYMFLKSELYSIAMSGEIELLSMLSTADIHAIGAEILLTWGGKVLSEITHPEVRKEVLQLLALDAPHIFFHNGVSYADLKLMASTLFNHLLADNQNIVDLGVLKKMRDFLPYMDKVVEASAADIKMFISSVHTSFLSRGVCTSMNNRNLLRNMILKGYGSPETWTSLDLVQLGDFLITMTKSDLMKVSVESVRRALPQLVDNSAYGILLPEVRGRSTPQLYYEACALWLNDGKDSDMGEGKAFIAAWRKLARWHLSGADLINLRNNPKETSRVKREGEEGDLDIEDTPDIDYRVLHDQVMKELMSRFKDLPKEDAAEAVSIISETQELLGNGSLIVMGDDPTLQAYTQSDVLNKIKEFKQGEEFTTEKEEQINKLALDSQVRLIQRLVTLLGLTAADLGVSAESIDHVKNLKAFQSVEEYVATAKYDFAPGTESSVDLISSENAGVDDILIDDTIKEKEIEKFLENPVPIDLDGINSNVATEPVEIGSAVVKPASIREVTVISLSCDDLRSAGRSATAINSRDINRMSTVELMNCLEYLGGLDFRAVDLPALWEAMYIKLKEEKSIVTGQEMINLGKLLPVIAESTPSYLNMSHDNLEAISVLGEHTSLLMNVFLDENAKINLNEFEIISLGKMMCGMSASQWSSLINEQLVMKLLLPQISSLDCVLSPEVSEEVFSALKVGLTGLELNEADAKLLTSSSDVQELNWLLSLLPAQELARIPPLVMDQVTEYGISNEVDLSELDIRQLANVAPQTASFINESQIQSLDLSQAYALLSAVGEDPVKIIEVEKLLARLQQEAAVAAEAEKADSSSKRRGSDDGSSATVLAPTLLVMLCSSVLL